MVSSVFNLEVVWRRYLHRRRFLFWPKKTIFSSLTYVFCEGGVKKRKKMILSSFGGKRVLSRGKRTYRNAPSWDWTHNLLDGRAYVLTTSTILLAVRYGGKGVMDPSFGWVRGPHGWRSQGAGEKKNENARILPLKQWFRMFLRMGIPLVLSVSSIVYFWRIGGWIRRFLFFLPNGHPNPLFSMF